MVKAMASFTRALKCFKDSVSIYTIECVVKE